MRLPPASPDLRPQATAPAAAPVCLEARPPRRKPGDVLLVVLFLGLLFLPMAAGMSGLQLAAVPGENRALAQVPAWPRTLAEFRTWPDRLSAFASDRFGLRDAMLWLDGNLRYHLFREAASDQVFFGRHGRIFLGSHVKGHPFSLIENICGLQTTPAQVSQSAADVAGLLDDAGRLVPHSLYVSIPTAPALYPEDLPPWLAPSCRNARPAAARVKAALAATRPDLANRMAYPVETMQALKAVGEPIPRSNFHWQDLGAKAVAEAVAEQGLGLPKRRDIPLRTITERSDLSQFLPGLDAWNAVGDPDYAQSGVVPCYGVSCAPGLEPFAAALTEVTRFQWREGSGPRLLLISDSFGVRAARYLGEYFAEVVHVNVNFASLTPGQGRQLRSRLFDIAKPDAVVFLFHDGSLGSAGAIRAELFGGPAAVPH